VATQYVRPSLNALRRRRLPRTGLFSKKVAISVSQEDFDQEGRVKSVTVSVHAPGHTPRGSNLGVGTDPSYVIGRRIECALDPTQAPGRVRSLNDMTPEERAKIAKELGANVPAAPTVKPRALCVEHLRLGPEYEYTVVGENGNSITWRKSDIFVTDDRYWREMRAVQGRFHLYRKDKFEHVYTVKPDQREAILALGVRAINRIEEHILKRKK